MRVLGLRTRRIGQVVVAARRIREYVRGAADDAGAVAGYYRQRGGVDTPGVGGWARGAGAALVGLRGAVADVALERVLVGRHARSGRALLPAAGSAGRTERDDQSPPPGALVPVEVAARAAGVSAGYLRRLARRSTAPVPELARLAAVREPGSGRWLVAEAELARFVAEREPPTVVMGYDLTCSAPKSVSLLWVFGDEALRRDVAAAVDVGVDAAIGYLERYATVGTVDGRNRLGLGLAVASYRHEVSRSDEAHLHVHNIIVNAVPVPVLDDVGRPVLDGRGVGRTEWRALDGEVLLAHAKTAGYLGAAALRHELSQRRQVAWAPVRNGVAEIAGFPPELLAAFSSRRGELLEEFAQLVDAGFDADAATLAAAQRRSRAPKRVLADAAVDAIQRGRLAAVGWTVERVRRLAPATSRRVTVPSEQDIAGLYARLAGPIGITERQPTFGRREAHQQVAAWAGDRLDAEQIGVLAERFLADPRVLLVDLSAHRKRNRREPAYTTLDLLDVERRLLTLCRRPPDRFAVRLPRDIIEQALTEADTDLRRRGDPGAALPDEQRGLVHRLLRSGRPVQLVLGPAGTGKTETMRAAARALAAAGHSVVGAANGGRQAEDLHQRLAVPTRVVSAWLTLLDHTESPGQVWRPGTVLLVDEATQVSTRDAARLLSHAAQTGTSVILTGDPAQLGSVGTGGWFADLVTADPTVPALHHNHRQRHPAMAEVRQALAALRGDTPGSARHALDRLAHDGRLQLCASRTALLAAAVTDWYTDRSTTPHSTHMLAETHRDADLLNAAARLPLAAAGALTGPTLTACGRDFQAGDDVITLTQAGHTLIPAGRPRSDYIRTGSIGTITAADPQSRTLTVHFTGKGTVRIGWDYLTHRFPDGRDGGLAHAYALTAHKAEGATLHTVRAVLPDDTSRAGTYVMLSRASHHLRGYLIARPDLDHDPTAETWLPILRDPRPPQQRLADRLAARRDEHLATHLDPAARTAHHLRSTTPLTKLQHGRDPARRRAAAAAEAALAAAAPTQPPADLTARIGPRPHRQPDRATWDAAVTAAAATRTKHPADADAPAADDLRRTEQLLDTAEANHLATQPTAALQREHHQLTTQIAAGPTSTADHAAARRRLRLLDQALARQLDHTALLLAHEPARYLVDLLGPRPGDPTQASAWETQALAIEHHRHYHLGLPNGLPAANPWAPPSHRALGPPGRNPGRQQLAGPHATLDLSGGA